MQNPKQLDVHLPGIIAWTKDLNCKYSQANHECATILGFKHPKDMLGLTYDLVPCKAAQLSNIFTEQDKRVMLGKKNIKFIEFHQYSDDQWKMLYISKSPCFNQKGKVIGTTGYGIDITVPFAGLIPFLFKGKLSDGGYSIISSFDEINIPKRPAECLFLLLRGKTAKEIARALKISPRTVEGYLEYLKLKFNCQNKSSLIEKAIEMGFMNYIPQGLLNHHLTLILE